MYEQEIELRELVVWALSVVDGLDYLGVFVECGTSNFATIPIVAAKPLAAEMARKFTTSHKEAWQIQLRGHFALKLYRKDGWLWDITIVTTGWRHYVGAVIFHLRSFIPKGKYLNLRNAREARKLYPYP